MKKSADQSEYGCADSASERGEAFRLIEISMDTCDQTCADTGDRTADQPRRNGAYDTGVDDCAHHFNAEISRADAESAENHGD